METDCRVLGEAGVYSSTMQPKCLSEQHSTSSEGSSWVPILHGANLWILVIPADVRHCLATAESCQKLWHVLTCLTCRLGILGKLFVQLLGLFQH